MILAKIIKQRKVVLLGIIAILSLSFKTSIHAQLQLDAQLRNRLEYRKGYSRLAQPGDVPAIFISQRTRISLLYQNENFIFHLTPQDVRIWGDENLASSTGVFGKNASLDLYEAYIDLKVRNNIRLSIGRQQLKYDQQRLLSGRNWNQNGMAYDAMVFKFNRDQWLLHIGTSWNSLNTSLQDNLYYPNRIKSQNYLWLSKNLSDKNRISLLHISSGITETDSTNNLNFRHTTGFYTYFESKNMYFTGNAYYQYGKNIRNQSISAFLLDSDISFHSEKNVSGIGISYLSGNKSATESTDRLFNVLYGARHLYFGSMDYFKNFEIHTLGSGLLDMYAYIENHQIKNVKLKYTGHYFWLAHTNILVSDRTNLGYESTLSMKYNFINWGNLESGYSFILPTGNLKLSQGISDNKFSSFFYLMLTLKPNLYKQ